MRDVVKAALSAIAGLFMALSAFAAQAQSQSQALPELPALDKVLKPEETAIIFVDFQNNFAAPKGEHYARFEKHYKETGMIEKAIDLAKQARARGIQVIHVTEGYTNDYRELDWGNAGTFHRAQILRQAWKAGTWEVDLLEALKPGPDDKDILLPNRIALSGFGTNGLDYILKSKGIRNIAVVGFTTDVCVYATTLSGYDLGYRVYSLTDIMAPADTELSNQLLKKSYPRLARIMESPEFLAMLPKKEAAATQTGRN